MDAEGARDGRSDEPQPECYVIGPAMLLFVPLFCALAVSQTGETERTEADEPRSFRLSEIELPRVPPPNLLRMRGSQVRPLTLRETLDELSFRHVEIAPKPTTVVHPSANPYATPRVTTGLGVRRTVVLGAIEMYAGGGAAVGVDATAATDEDDRNLLVAPLGRFGVRMRPTRDMKIGVDFARVGPASFDPLGEELRALASLRWRFSLVPRR